jgi:hypothetical protein
MNAVKSYGEYLNIRQKPLTFPVNGFYYLKKVLKLPLGQFHLINLIVISGMYLRVV